MVPILVKFFQISPNFGFVFKYVPIFVNFVQLGPFLLTPFKSLTSMNNECHVSLRGFFQFFWILFIYLFIFYLKLFNFFLNVHMSIQECATCHFVVFLIFLIFFLNVHMSTSSVPCVKVNVLNSIWSLYLLFLFN